MKMHYKIEMLGMALIACLCTSFAFAKPASSGGLVLRQSPTAIGTQVSVGDVFENAGDKANMPLTRAPLARQKLVYNSTSLQTKLNSMGLTWSNPDQLQQVVIWGREANLDKEQSGNYLSGNNYIPNNNYANNYANNSNDREIAVLNRNIARNEIITTDMISWIKVNNNVSYGALVDASDLIGKTTNRNIDANKPISASDVSAPKAVKRGDTIILVYEIGTLRISASGKALADGFVGSKIKAVNTNSNKTIDAVVQDTGIAKVTTNNAQFSAR